jgi:AcrR family transcriptional regulator
MRPATDPVSAKRGTVQASRADGARSRRAILEAASALATVEGLDGLSLARLADHIGMSKSGLYAHFGSKEDLQLATIEMALDTFSAEVVQPTADIDDPLLRVQALCDRFLNYLARRVFPGGCFFAAAAAEFDTHPGPVKERIAETQHDWMRLLEGLFRQAQRRRRLKATETPAQLAFETDAQLLMANMMFVLHDDERALERAREAIKARIAAATV